MYFGRLEHPLSELQKNFDRFFVPDYPRYGRQYPYVNIQGKEDEALVTMELPGVDPNTLDITVKKDILTIEGKRPPLEKTVVKKERFTGEFQRSIRLPFRIDGDQVRANYQKGILHISLQQVPEDKPKKIRIQS